MPLAIRYSLSIAVVLLAGVAFAQEKTPVPVGQPAPLPPPDAKAIAATVNGTPIFERAVYRAVRVALQGKQAEAREQVINFLIDNILVDQYLDQLKITAEPKEIDKAVDELKDEIKKDKKEYEKVLQDLFITEAELREQLGAELRWRKFLDKYGTDKVLSDFFNTNKSFFDGSQVRARHILVPAKRDDAKEIETGKSRVALLKKQIEDRAAQELAKAPASQDALEKEKARTKALETAFSEVAGKESSCPSKADGGEVGWFARSGRMVEPFARTAFALKPYQMSDAVVTDFGCHLILPTDTKPGREVKYDDMKEVTKEVYGDRMREAIIARARPAARIVINPAPATKQ